MLGAVDDPALELTPSERIGRSAVPVDLDPHLMHRRFDVRIDLVSILGDDRDLPDLVEQPLGEPVDLGGCRGAARKDTEVHANLDRGRLVTVQAER